MEDYHSVGTWRNLELVPAPTVNAVADLSTQVVLIKEMNRRAFLRFLPVLGGSIVSFYRSLGGDIPVVQSRTLTTKNNVDSRYSAVYQEKLLEHKVELERTLIFQITQGVIA